MLSGYRAFNAVMKELAGAAPDKVIAAGFDTTQACCLSHLGEAGYSIYLEIFGGGYGASVNGDGCDAVDSPLSNCSNIPVEAMDMEHDYFRVVEYSTVPGSGGAGMYRGGWGLRRVYEVLDDNVTFATYSDRFRIAPAGLFGGEPGERASTYVIRGNETIELGSKLSFALEKGDRLVMTTGGGAGYGDAANRRAELKALDRVMGQ